MHKGLFVAFFTIIILFVFSIPVSTASSTNISILYGWNGSTFVPVLTNESGVLQTDINITTSIGINPKVNNTYDLGSIAKIWANIYTRSLRSSSTLSLFAGNTEAITILSSGFVGIGTTNPNAQLTVNGNISFTNGPRIMDDNGKEIVTKGVPRKSTTPYNRNILGAISTTPGLILGNYDSSEKSLLALAGRTPVKVSAENGPIDIDDYLTSSSTPGIAMKATQPGVVVGRALVTSEGALGKIDVLVGTKESNFVDDISARQEQIDMLSQQNQRIKERITVLEAIISSKKG